QPGPRAAPRPHPPAWPAAALPALPRPLRLRARADGRASLALPPPALAAQERSSELILFASARWLARDPRVTAYRAMQRALGDSQFPRTRQARKHRAEGWSQGAVVRPPPPGSAVQWGTVTVVVTGLRLPAGSVHSTEMV